MSREQNIKKMNNAYSTQTMVSVGSVIAFAGNSSSVPPGWLVCDGQSIPLQYSELIDLIGNTLPNLGGNVIIGTNENYPLNTTGGETAHTLSVDEIPSHNHSVITQFPPQGFVGGVTVWGSGGNHTQGYEGGDNQLSNQGNITIGNNGGGNSHNNMQPYYVLNYIIYAGNI